MDIDARRLGLRRERAAGERGPGAGRTRRVEVVWVLAVLLVLLVSGSVMAQVGAGGRRVALVIGNSVYAHTGELENPVNDATAMRDALTRLDFDVVFRRDADEDAMDDALGVFEEMSAGAELALVFYAGHGMEMNGNNYLVPVDARLSSAAAVARETVSLDDVLNAVVDATTRIVILDACRNNPFTRSMRGAVRANVRSGGLAAVAAGAGSLVAYAAAAGDVADDGDGRHSPFTEALLAHIEQPGVDVRIMLGNVGEAVRDRTARQQPFIYSSLSGEHYLGDVTGGPNPAAVETALGLNRDARRAVQLGLVSAGFAAGVPDGVFGPTTRTAIRAWQRSRGAVPSGYLDASSSSALGAPVASAPPVAVPPAASGSSAAAVLQQETVFWQSIQGSTDPADFEAYLELFTNGTFSRLARNRLAALRAVDGGAGSPATGRPGGGAPASVSGIASAGVDAPRRPGDVFRDCEECPEMVVLPGGGLALGRYEVTVGEYRAFASATGGGAGDCFGLSWQDPGFPQTDRQPVTCMSWDDAQAYVSWLSRRTGATYRLPTEAEWERAAEGSQAGCYYSARPGNLGTCPVGSYGSNAAGLSDMVGNLWEWTSDCWEGDCGRRVLRGGSWHYLAVSLRPGARSRSAAGNRGNSLGFRVSRTLD